MPLTLITAATTYAVSVAELKSHLRIQTTADDELIGLYSQVAERTCEHKTNRAISRQTWMMTLTSFPGSTDDIPVVPIPLSTSAGGVTIKYITCSGATSSMATSLFEVDTDCEPNVIRLTHDATGKQNEWPDTLEHQRAVQITIITGYDGSAAVPQPIQQWIKMRVGQMYEFREPIVAGETFQNLRRDFVDGLLDRYLVISGDSL